jgi:predicted ATPase
MIEKIRLRNFKGHQDTEVPLGRLTMLVGDNASGKTSVLEALWLQAAMFPNPSDVLKDSYAPADLVRRGSDGKIKIESDGLRSAGSPRSARNWGTRLTIDPANATEWGGASLEILGSKVGAIGGGRPTTKWEELPLTVGTAQLYSLDAKKIAAVAASDSPDVKIGSDGQNTGPMLASLKLGNDEIFDRIEAALRALIPSVERIRIRQALLFPGTTGPIGHKITFDFIGAPGVPAHCASHGTLIVLSLLTILFGPQRPNLVLLDDFDHALHPRAQMELMRMLKDLLELPEFVDLQIVATTHSPYTLDELDASEVHAFALRPDGAVASKRLSEHPEAARTKGVLRAGQLWSLDPEREWFLGA